ncbi:hypothetical protein Hypma_001777 [Hypsizygus marmoreus]|uniref:Uncharacterized protein n=1 Tax=Hypsizygus marmoreus TaxID=39966 RepID=A0A369JDX8_HYPMA|nr:hypothetical protein Hypma_001777 [Hypsizygus marmoreus]
MVQDTPIEIASFVHVESESSTSNQTPGDADWLHDFIHGEICKTCGNQIPTGIRHSPSYIDIPCTFTSLSFLPLLAFLSISLFIVLLVAIVAVSVGAFLVLALQFNLALICALTVILLAMLSALITALLVSAAFVFKTAKGSFQHFAEISSQYDWDTLPSSLNAYVVNLAPGWRTVVVDQASKISIAFSQIPLKKYRDKVAELLCAIPWQQSFDFVMAGAQTALSALQTGFSVVRLLASFLQVVLLASKSLFLILKASVTFCWSFLTSHATPAEVPVPPVSEEALELMEAIGASSSRSSSSFGIHKRAGKTPVSESEETDEKI